ncbi:PadR family transcriptional regulator [candidate division KSB1 bacterium]
MTEITKFEEQILLSVWKLGENAYGISIYNYIKEMTGRKLAIGGIYFPLERLVKKRYLDAIKGEPTPIRGGQSKRYYSLTKRGVEALLKARETQTAFWKDLPDIEHLKETVK